MLGSSVPYPSISEFGEALQAPSVVFSDPELKTATVEKNGLGMPLVACGGFALTYTLTSKSTNKYAVRCFHKKAPELEKRYSAISNEIKRINSSYFVNVEFQAQGIAVKGNKFPIVKMMWASGETLGEFVEKNYRNLSALGNLEKALQKIAEFLENNNIAHGDIQPGNLMVSNNGNTIQLIDYDGMYVSSLSTLGASETGHRNFQHPQRETLQPWNSHLDRFSFILISLALKLLQINPNLWDKTQSDGDAFLFKANDLVNPDSSSIFSEAKLTAIKSLVENFRNICLSSFNNIPTLNDFLRSLSIPVVSAISTIKSTAYSYISAFEVINSTYAAAQKNIGNKVELIGVITDIKVGKTKYGKPYTLLNFGDWRKNIVTLAAWCDSGLEVSFLRTLIGQWVSVLGTIEPEYVSKRFKYKHFTITISTQNIPHIISADEAKKRLNSKANPVVGNTTGGYSFSGTQSQNARNSDLPKSSLYTPKPLTPNQQKIVSSPQTRNETILAEILGKQKQNKPSSGGTSQQVSPSHTNLSGGTTSGVQNNTRYQQSNVRKNQSNDDGCLTVLIWIAIIIAFFLFIR